MEIIHRSLLQNANIHQHVFLYLLTTDILLTLVPITDNVCASFSKIVTFVLFRQSDHFSVEYLEMSGNFAVIRELAFYDGISGKNLVRENCFF